MNNSSMYTWQATAISCMMVWVVVVASISDLTRRIRSLLQPWVTRRAIADTPFILRLQELHNGFLDNLFSALSVVVSISFYTGFIPLLFWSGHSKLARQMTMLLFFCDYAGNSIKDIVSAPRPSSPPVRRLTATEDEKENAMEYGLPSSHSLNTVCLCGFLLYYALTNWLERDAITVSVGLGIIFVFIFLVAIGRIYLGMHSVIDVVAGIGIGLALLALWFGIHQYVDDLIFSGQNVTTFWASLSILLCFSYPTPELPTPSFENHAAFSGVAFGVVSGIQQTYAQFHHQDVPSIFSPQLPLAAFLVRILVGIPTILAVKFCSKGLAKLLLPKVCKSMGIPIRSSRYIPALKEPDSVNNKSDRTQLSYLHKAISFLPRQKFDVDNGIRFIQFVGLAWSTVDLVPSLFARLNL